MENMREAVILKREKPIKIILYRYSGECVSMRDCCVIGKAFNMKEWR